MDRVHFCRVSFQIDDVLTSTRSWAAPPVEMKLRENVAVRKTTTIYVRQLIQRKIGRKVE